MNGIDKLKQWKRSILFSIQLDISLFKCEFKDNLKSFGIETIQKILAGVLLIPTILFAFFRACLTVLLVGLGVYLFFWLYILFMKAGIYILGVLALGWFFIAKK
jgi:hypothetical protein